MDIYVDGYEYGELHIGDKVMIVVDSQYDDYCKRRLGEIGAIVEIDPGDTWAYRVEFSDGGCNWFKRYHLKCVVFTMESSHN